MLQPFCLIEQVLNRGHDTGHHIAETSLSQGLINIIRLRGTGVTPIQSPSKQSIALGSKTPMKRHEFRIVDGFGSGGNALAGGLGVRIHLGETPLEEGPPMVKNGHLCGGRGGGCKMMSGVFNREQTRSKDGLIGQSGEYFMAWRKTQLKNRVIEEAWWEKNRRGEVEEMKR